MIIAVPISNCIPTISCYLEVNCHICILSFVVLIIDGCNNFYINLYKVHKTMVPLIILVIVS